MWFLSPEGAVGGGGGEESRGMAAVDDPPVGGEPVVETPPQTVDVDKLTTALADKFGGVLSKMTPAAPKETPKKIDELTPEDAKKLLKIWEPDDNFLKDFDNLETKKAAITRMRDGLIGQADTISQHRMREALAPVLEQLQPVIKFMQDYQSEQLTNRFTGRYEQLGSQEIRPLINAVAEDLASKGKKFDTEEELFDALAKGVEKVIQVSNKDFKLSAAGSNPATNKGRNNNAIPAMTPGSGGGTGSAPKGDEKVKRGLAVFGPVPKAR